MPKRKPKGQQIDTIGRAGNLFQPSFNLTKQDEFVTALGIQFAHFKAMPSPIGLKERGDYRRSDSLDTISSNGMMYFKTGCFTATLTGNSKNQRNGEHSIIDESIARIVMPRFYDKGDAVAGGDRIYLAPGDRVYIADPNADVKVPNYQRMEYVAGVDNKAQFPIKKIEFVQDSRGITFEEGKDFEICDGNIRWLPGGQNPGIDPDTKKGRVYSVRYLYNAFWYVVSIPNEVRITNVTNNGIRSPERMSYFAVVQREFVYQSKINGGPEAKPNEDARTRSEPIQSLDPNSSKIKVNMSDYSEE